MNILFHSTEIGTSIRQLVSLIRGGSSKKSNLALSKNLFLPFH